MDHSLYRPITERTPLPTASQAMELWDKYEMLENIRDHSRVVTMVAVRIGRWLNKTGLSLNLEAVEAGGLLHDIAKTMCLGKQMRHDMEGGEIMEREGYPEIAWMVRYHVLVPRDHPLDEAMVVNYADKRVNHDQVVSLEERYEYISGRYGRGDPAAIERIAKGLQRLKGIEHGIFSRMDGRHSPEEITRLWKEGAL